MTEEQFTKLINTQNGILLILSLIMLGVFFIALIRFFEYYDKNEEKREKELIKKIKKEIEKR